MLTSHQKQQQERIRNVAILDIGRELSGCGIGDILSERVATFFARQAIERSKSVMDLIRDDPYILIDVLGFSLDRADKVAFKLDVPRDDARRTAAVIKIVLRTNTTSGHTYLPYEQLKKKSKKAGVFEEDLDDVLQTMIDSNAIIYEVDVDIVDSSTPPKMIAKGTRIYLKHFYDAEVEAAAYMLERLERNDS